MRSCNRNILLVFISFVHLSLVINHNTTSLTESRVIGKDIFGGGPFVLLNLFSLIKYAGITAKSIPTLSLAFYLLHKLKSSLPFVTELLRIRSPIDDIFEVIYINHTRDTPDLTSCRRKIFILGVFWLFRSIRIANYQP